MSEMYPEGSHYPLCVKYISGDDLPCICDLLDEHATEVRERIERNLAQVLHDASAGPRLHMRGVRVDSRGDS